MSNPEPEYEYVTYAVEWCMPSVGLWHYARSEESGRALVFYNLESALEAAKRIRRDGVGTRVLRVERTEWVVEA